MDSIMFIFFVYWGGLLVGKLPSPVSRPETTDGSVSVYLRIFQAVDDPGLFKVLGAHFHFNDVANRDLNEVLAQFARNMGKHLMPVLELGLKHGTGEDGGDLALYFDDFFS